MNRFLRIREFFREDIYGAGLWDALAQCEPRIVTIGQVLTAVSLLNSSVNTFNPNKSVTDEYVALELSDIHTHTEETKR